MQALRFLHDLGSIQYFEREGLNNRIIINPQWIIDAMACIISVKKNAVQVNKQKSKRKKIIFFLNRRMENYLTKI